MPFTTLEAGQGSQRFPRFLPGGKWFLVYVRGGPDVRGIYLGSPDSAKMRRVVNSDMPGDYVPGWLLFLQEETLFAQRFEPEDARLIGNPVKVGSPVGADGTVSLGAFSASPAGVIAYRAKGATSRQLIWFDQKGTQVGLFGPQDESGLSCPRISPKDNSRLAVERSLQGNQKVWIMEPNPQPFTSASGTDASPVWSPDGKWIVFRSDRAGPGDLYLKSAVNVGDEMLLWRSPELKVATSWREDSLLFYSINPETGLRSIWVLPVTEDGKAGGKPAQISSPNIDWDEINAQFSLDGRFVAYQSDESKQREIYVVPFSRKSRPRQVSTGGGIWPQWSRKNQELYYLRPQDSMIMAVSLTEKDGNLVPSATSELFRARILTTAVSTYSQYDVDSLDRFLINVPAEGAFPLTLILNWKPPAA